MVTIATKGLFYCCRVCPEPEVVPVYGGGAYIPRKPIVRLEMVETEERPKYKCTDIDLIYVEEENDVENGEE